MKQEYKRQNELWTERERGYELGRERLPGEGVVYKCCEMGGTILGVVMRG